jgi:streptogramin lyase
MANTRLIGIIAVLTAALAFSCSSKKPTKVEPQKDTGGPVWGDATEDQSGDDTGIDREIVEGEDTEPGVDSIPGVDVVQPDGGTGPGKDVTEGVDTIENPTCVDKDEDGYGKNCNLGVDCDDANPNFTVFCPPCQFQNAEGCKCSQNGLVEFCYDGDPSDVGIGECRMGERRCDGKYWSSCAGQVLAKAEACDSVDNDCDGMSDEGVLSPCGNCDPLCDTLKAGPDSENPFDPRDDNSSGVGLNVDGYLVLDSTKVNLSFIWIANSGEGTVSKLDTKTGREMGRYFTCSDPSRTAVDLIGDVWVGCRGDGRVAKIAIDEAVCIDRNNNGTIETSRDANGDGRIQPGEMMPKGQDECVLFVVQPGGSIARAAGVDKDNHCWIGSWGSAEIYRLHPDDGHVVQTIKLPTSPYGLVIDGNGIIWCATLGSTLLRADPKTGQVQSISGPSNYGITVDMKGRPWIGSSTARYDPANGQWTSAGVYSRGVAGSTDGFMYAATGSTVYKINIDTMQVETLNTNGSGAVGVALDSEGYVWAINQGSSNASKIDPKTKQVFGPYPVGSGPYTYSDMTGYALHNFTAPRGNYSTIIGGFNEIRVKWTALDIDAELPENAHLEVEVRTAATIPDLASAKWKGPFGPFPPQNFPLDLTTIDGMDKKYLEVRVWLYSGDKTSTPVVKSIDAKFSSGK